MDKFKAWDQLVYSGLDKFIEVIDGVIPFTMKTLGKLMCVIYLLAQSSYYVRGLIPGSFLIFPFFIFLIMLVLTDHPRLSRMEEAAILYRLIMTVFLVAGSIPHLFMSGSVISLIDSVAFWIWVYTMYKDRDTGSKRRVPLWERLSSWSRQGIGSPLPSVI